MPTQVFELDQRVEYGSYWKFEQSERSEPDVNGLYVHKRIVGEDDRAPKRLHVGIDW